MATKQHKIVCVREFIKTVYTTVFLKINPRVRVEHTVLPTRLLTPMHVKRNVT